jgi:PTH1 family peptidyl-tRNA hydrolase
MNSFLIAGLGNIGEEYENTRHNIGFKVVEACAKKWGAPFDDHQRYASVAEASVKGRKVILIKPSTYVNLSGKAVRYWLTEGKVKMENLLVIVDELALPFGSLRLGSKGSDGGHNGLKSIQEILQTNQYARLRFGIGNDFPKGGQVNYVLGQWSGEEEAKLKERIDKAVEGIETFCFIGIDRAMNGYNGK